VAPALTVVESMLPSASPSEPLLSRSVPPATTTFAVGSAAGKRVDAITIVPVSVGEPNVAVLFAPKVVKAAPPFEPNVTV